MSHNLKLTKPQQNALLSSIDSRPFDGLITFRDAGVGVGLRRASWARMMGKLAESGLVTAYVHGGFELTPEGVRVRQELVSALQPRPGK